MNNNFKHDLIKTIIIDKANLEHIAKTGNINGTLFTEISRVMTQYRQGKTVDIHTIKSYYDLLIAHGFKMTYDSSKGFVYQKEFYKVIEPVNSVSKFCTFYLEDKILRGDVSLKGLHLLLYYLI